MNLVKYQSEQLQPDYTTGKSHARKNKLLSLTSWLVLPIIALLINLEKVRSFPVYGDGRPGFIGVHGDSDTTYGGYFTSINNAGVYGYSLNNTGVSGNSNSFYGVDGNSVNNDGVHGGSTYSFGVYGSSISSAGVYGTSNYIGVYGNSTSGFGVVGTTASGTGVYGSSSSAGYSAYFTGGAGGSGTCYYNGGAGFSCTSDRNLKENFTPIDVKDILQRVNQLPITRWNMKGGKKNDQHIGPMAQDFYSTFAIGQDDKHINTADIQGVTLAAIQGLYQVVVEKDNQLQQQAVEIGQLKKQIASLQQQQNQIARLQKEIDAIQVQSIAKK